ncbi:DUF3572 domain-containing protein [Gimibacter soli]|uniref:DUF3572 domain-containing protein n=1 Tax=Gimibacter soli TaxID=3024400 RepID=A0AAE9XWE6_9PROT|nr:DUF3572 domain-containing protein [Gimibacter soli]WCL55698.1 DUF3572 domain-containing protein [Gimibacter soli]
MPIQTIEAETMALQAVAHIVAEDALRDRFFAITGLDADALRAGLSEADMQASVLGFLIDFEPDLVEFAASVDRKPEDVVAAWRALGGGKGVEW